MSGTVLSLEFFRARGRAWPSSARNCCGSFIRCVDHLPIIVFGAAASGSAFLRYASGGKFGLGFITSASIYSLIAVGVLMWENRTSLLSCPPVVFCILAMVFFVVEQFGVRGDAPSYERYVIEVAPFFRIITFVALPQLNLPPVLAPGRSFDARTRYAVAVCFRRMTGSEKDLVSPEEGQGYGDGDEQPCGNKENNDQKEIFRGSSWHSFGQR